MRMSTGFKGLVAVGAMLAAGSALAATPVVDGGGKLTGATGVVVGSATYNVAFVDGTCGSVFTGCDAASDFTFQTQDGARAARDALLTQVFLGTYDTTPGLTAGCALGAESCIVYVPYAIDGSNVLGASLNNGIGSNTIGDSSTPTSFDLTQFSGQTYARFSLASTAVPEPASWAMMLLGFAGIGMAVRRRGVAQTFSRA